MEALNATPVPKTAADPSKVRQAAQEAQLQRAAKEFESLFVNMLMKNMRSTVLKSDLIDNGGGIETYRSLLDEEMSKKAAEGPNGMGIADMIVNSFRAQMSGEAPERPSVDQPHDFQPVPRPTMRRALAAYGVEDRSGAVSMERNDLADRALKLGTAAADTLQRYEREITAAAAETGQDPELILAVILQESSGRADAVSRVGASGLMQLMPGTAKEMGVDDALDPGQNIRGGTRYLAELKNRFGDDLDLVLAGYNAGPGRVERAGRNVPDIDETRNYVAKVGDMYRTLKGGPDGTAEEETP